MDKPAVTRYDIHELLKKRWSPRAFDERPIEATILQRLFEAARWAPSAMNEQPWRFILGCKPEMAPRTRLDFDQFIFETEFGHPSSIFTDRN
ncbi:MAG: hypothetical protein FJY10_00320 [Bacteroidetes bacterium]|nr:hypothetical protein [Bacteroidota bacterium]